MNLLMNPLMHPLPHPLLKPLTNPLKKFAPSVIVLVVLALALPMPAHAQSLERELYDSLKAFRLEGGSHAVDGLVIERDRARLTFTGTFYFEAPMGGQVHGAVFVGTGTFSSEVPDTPFERAHVARMIGSERVESNFTGAVLRFTDDTFDLIGPAAAGVAPDNAQNLANRFGTRFLEETGANLASRLVVSIANNETPGFFVAEFDGGNLGRFTLLLDRQGRIPSTHFNVNAGEKGMIYANRASVAAIDIWTAFYSVDDVARGTTDYSDTFELIDTEHYAMNVDLTDPRDHLGVEARIEGVSRIDGLRVIPFAIGESLPYDDGVRRERNMRLQSARLPDGTSIEAVQEEWEGGFTVFLPEAVNSGAPVEVVVTLEGDFMLDATAGRITQNFYPMSNSEWYPRHGYLDRATYDLIFVAAESHTVVSAGALVSRDEAEGRATTHWRFEHPVAFVTFAAGLFDFYEESGLIEGSDIPIHFYPIRAQAIDESFIAAEMGNAINYFTANFGPYPYESFTGVHHPLGFGQGFASMLLLPTADTNNREVYRFLAHETAHQWWGNIVAWRSYRDQWLSEGFAEYSGLLYAGLRDGSDSEREMIEIRRQSLRNSPRTTRGIGEGRLVDLGPIIMGLRLNSTQSQGAYQTLIYDKGAMVLRMLHYLLSNPLTGDGAAFFEMMADFVETHRNGRASTDDFIRVANTHFARSTLARMTGVSNLDWFFQEWVYNSFLPAYRMEYRLDEQADGTYVASGTVFQDDVPAGFFMPLPVIFEFNGGLVGRFPVFANGPETPFTIPLPQRPEDVRLDPEMWILSSETETRRR